MIKYFRKIRQNLISEGKTSKYLKYAIGEIVLVVIGILIALQINNWNENRKNQSFEQQILRELVQDIASDTANINAQLRRYNRIINQINYRLNDTVRNDSLSEQFDLLFAGISFNLNLTTYETLQGKGLHTLRNGELRRSISEYYNKCQWYLDMIQRENNNFQNIYQEPFIKEYIRISYDDSDDPNRVPKDWESLLESEEFENFLGFKKRNLIYSHYFYNAIIKRAEETMSDIQPFLKAD